MDCWILILDLPELLNHEAISLTLDFWFLKGIKSQHCKKKGGGIRNCLKFLVLSVTTLASIILIIPLRKQYIFGCFVYLYVCAMYAPRDWKRALDPWN